MNENEKAKAFGVRLRGLPLYWNGVGFAYGVYWKSWTECTSCAKHYNDLAIAVEIVSCPEWEEEERAKERLREEFEKRQRRDEMQTLKGYLKHKKEAM